MLEYVPHLLTLAGLVFTATLTQRQANKSRIDTTRLNEQKEIREAKRDNTAGEVSIMGLITERIAKVEARLDLVERENQQFRISNHALVQYIHDLIIIIRELGAGGLIPRPAPDGVTLPRIDNTSGDMN